MQINTIYQQDIFDFLRQLPNQSADLAIIDPPYNLSVADWDTFASEQEFLNFSFVWIDLMIPKLKPNASFYLFNTPTNCALFYHHLRGKAVLQNWITWYKKDGMSASKKRFNNAQETILFYTMHKKDYYFDCESVRIPYQSTQRITHAKSKGILKNGKLCLDVWEIVSERHKNKVHGKTIKMNHPTPKPREMIERMILASSKEGDLVLDLFSGTGITSKVARELGAKFFGL